MAFTGQVGGSLSYPGNIVPGAGSGSTPLNASVTNTLNLSQSIDVIKVISLDVTSTLTFTQTVAHIIGEDVTSTLTFTQTIDFTKEKLVPVIDNLVFTQTISANHTSNKLVNHNLNLNQTITKNYSLNRSITQSLNLTQSISHVVTRPITNTLTFTQTVSYLKTKKITSTLELQQLIDRNLISNRTITQLFTPFQHISLNKISNLSVTSNLNFTQSVQAYRVYGLEHHLNLTQTIEVDSTKTIQHILTFDQEINYNAIRNIVQTQKLNLKQTITVNKVVSKSIVNVLAFDQFIKQRRGYNLTVTDTLNLTQNLVRTRYNLTVTSSLNLTQSINRSRISTLNVQSNLNLQSILNKQSITFLTVSHLLDFRDSYTRYMGGVEIEVPTLLVAKSQRFTSFQYGTEVIILPNPNFGDGEGNTGLFSIRRGWRGKSYTYVKKTDFRKLSYTFNISLKKSIELEGFLERNNSNLLEMRNWKGEIWKVFITNNPIEFHAVGRAESCDQERVEVTLDLEGIRLGTNSYDLTLRPGTEKTAKVRR
jgi:hypothetical protein